MSLPHAPTDDERIAAIVLRATGSAAHELNLTTGEQLQAFGWPAIESLVRHVEWHWRRHLNVRPITEYLKDIETLLALAEPQEFDYTTPLDRRLRNLCGKLWMFGPGDRKAYELHFVDKLSSVDTHLSVKYGGRHALISFNSCRIMSAATLAALRIASPHFLRGYVDASLEDSPEYRTALYDRLEAREL